MSTKHKAFTLVEILVVIALVALLSALLFGVFQQVKKRARTSICSNNLRQISSMCEMYAADNGGRYPNAPTPCAWADRLYPYARNTSTFECPSARNSPYLTGCPPMAGPDNLDEFGQPVNFYGGYGMVLFYKKPFPKSAVLKNPSKTISVLDGSGNWISPEDQDLSNDAIFLSSGIRRPRHGDGNNALFFRWPR